MEYDMGPLPVVVDPDVMLFAVTVESSVRIEDEFMVTLSSGSGMWADRNTGTMLVVSDILDIDLRFGWMIEGLEPEVRALIEAIDTTLARWERNKTSLRIVSGPGSPLYLIESEKRWLPIPRI